MEKSIELSGTEGRLVQGFMLRHKAAKEGMKILSLEAQKALDEMWEFLGEQYPEIKKYKSRLQGSTMTLFVSDEILAEGQKYPRPDFS